MTVLLQPSELFYRSDSASSAIRLAYYSDNASLAIRITSVWGGAKTNKKARFIYNVSPVQNPPTTFGKAMFGEKEWYFFSPRDRKYPNGSRPNRVAGSGYWKATGTDKIIMSEGRKVGIKKALVFYIGKAPKGTKTNWIMHEYRLSDPQRRHGSAKLDDWVLCRIYKKNSSAEKTIAGGIASAEQSQSHSHGSSSSCSSQFDNVMESLPQIDDRFFNLPRMNSLNDWAAIAEQLGAPTVGNQTQALHSNNNNYHNVPCNLISQPGCLDTRFKSSTDEEVESGFKNHTPELMNFDGYSQCLTNSVDRFAIRYPNHHGNVGFRQ